jgi:enamine deaminase RidA (YjgF/YER057c/UK114 family)
MSRIRERLAERGLALPPPSPAGLQLPFAWVRVRGRRVFTSGHGALDPEGHVLGPFGKVPTEVAVEAAGQSAVLGLLAMLAGIERAIGDLDRIDAWMMVNGLVNAEPGFAQTTAVINPVSELILDLFGSEVGTHARTAVGVVALPMNFPVVVAAELEIN